MAWGLWDLTVCDSWIPLTMVSQVRALNNEDEGIWGSFCFLHRLSNNPAVFTLGFTTLRITCVANSWDIWSSVVQVGLVFTFFTASLATFLAKYFTFCFLCVLVFYFLHLASKIVLLSALSSFVIIRFCIFQRLWTII